MAQQVSISNYRTAISIISSNNQNVSATTDRQNISIKKNNLTQSVTINNTETSTIDTMEGYLNVTDYTGTPDGYTYTKDVTIGITAAIAAVVGMDANKRKGLFFPPGFYYITNTIDFSGIDGWEISGVPNRTIIAIKSGTTIDGPIFNFNYNSSTIRRYNTITGLYFFSDSTLGTASQVVDFSYNNRFGMYQCRTSRISTETDIAVNFAYEGYFERCNLSGGRGISPTPRYSNGVHLADEANAILFNQCSIDNYIGNGSTIEGAGVIFEGSKGITLDTCTMQKCDYGLQLGTGSKGAMVIGGGYWEGNRKADIRIGNGSSGSIYDTQIIGGSVKSGLGTTVAGLLFDKSDVYGLSVIGTEFDNDDPIQLISRTNQVLQDIKFQNVRTGDTIYSFRNLVDSSAVQYMDNIIVESPGTELNGQQSPTFTPILCDPITNYCSDFNDWLDGAGGAIDFLSQDGTWLGSPSWKKTNTDSENMIFTLSDVSGFQNQVVRFSCWIKFNGSINANDIIQIENQTNNTKIGAQRPLRPGTLSTIGFVKINVYGLVGASDTAIRVKILTRDQNIYFTKPELKLGFV